MVLLMWMQLVVTWLQVTSQVLERRMRQVVLWPRRLSCTGEKKRV